ncbi:MAG: hypothetical protein PHN85_10590, partial [Kiritimatiellae bacterium]|nr:hypothetical protein [Kiritimatiellia bacterium]
IGKSRYAIGDDRFRQGAEEEHKERRRSGRRESGHRRLWRKIPRSAPPSESQSASERKHNAPGEDTGRV